jgi:hypothetical protein
MSLLRIFKAAQDQIAMRLAVTAEYPTLEEMNIRHRCLMWSVVVVVYKDLSEHLADGPSALRKYNRYKDNMAEAIDFLNGRRLHLFVTLSPIAIQQSLARSSPALSDFRCTAPIDCLFFRPPMSTASKN